MAVSDTADGVGDKTIFKLHDSIKDLITTYHELNPATIDELYEEPSPLEFLRYASRNRPFVLRKGAQDWLACQKWNAEYLRNAMLGQTVNVAMTPLGNADAPLELPDGRLVFVKPYESEQDFSNVLSRIAEPEFYQVNNGNKPTQQNDREPVLYAQTQNDNLRNEYATLFADVPKDIPFARVALQQGPDAVNFWLGNARSTTALHRDNYENIYVQVLGQKHFVLLPPVEAACVNETTLPAATYVPGGDAGGLIAKMDEPAVTVPFATWDPDDPERRATTFSQYSQAVRVTLDEGDMLYLPAMWYHKVKQSNSKEGICCAVNYWYDMEFSGALWALASFGRSTGMIVNRYYEKA